MKKSLNDSEPTGEQMALFLAVGSRNHAKDLASPDLGPEQKMTVTSGRNLSAQLTGSTPIGLLAKMLLESSVWKINPAFTGMYSLKWNIVKLPAFIRLTTMKQYTHDRLKCSSTVSVKVLKKEDMRSKRLLFRLQVLVRRTKGKGSGLLLATPSAQPMADVTAERAAEMGWTWSGTSWIRADGSKVQSTLNHQVAMLPTPSAMVVADVDMEKLDARRQKAKDKHINGNGFGASLNELAVKGMLPTPMSRDYRSPDVNPDSKRQMQNSVLNSAVTKLFPTPTNSMVTYQDFEQAKFHSSKRPKYSDVMLPTPSAVEAAKAVANTHQNSLTRMVKRNQLMNTPSAQDGKNSCLPESQLNLDSVVGDILKTGVTGQLNPQFVLEMMGFPSNWTLLPFLTGETKVSKEQEMP